MSVNAEKPTVLVDMDGVLADFDGALEDILRERHPHIPIIFPRKHFKFTDEYEEHQEAIRAIHDSEGFFENLPLNQGALYGWQRIIDLGYMPRICSAPISANAESANEKRRWLKKHLAPEFGSWVVETAIIDKRKDRYDGIALIDDRPKVIGADQAIWTHVIFDQSYNEGIEGLRLLNWFDPSLAEILDECERRYIQFGRIASK